MVFRLARRAERVVGVELSPRHVAWAERRPERTSFGNVTFEVGDAAHLDHHGEGAFDVAVVVLALHEMPPDARAPVLRSLGRVARRVLVVDFTAPMPWNLAGLRNRLLEVGAGPEHFGGYLDFARSGGIDPLVEAAGLARASQVAVDQGTLTVTWAHRPDSPSAGGVEALGEVGA